MQWISVKSKEPPTATRLLVVKYYLDQKWSSEEGGHRGPFFPTESFVALDYCWGDESWGTGGIVTHWMQIPEIPNEKN